MGRGGVGVWDVTVLGFSSKRAAACRAILASSCKNPAECDLEQWYYDLLSAMEILSDTKHEFCFPTGGDGVSLSDEIACSLFEVADQFALEDELNRDGFFTYAQVVDPVDMAKRMRAFIRAPGGTSVSKKEQEEDFLATMWVPRIRDLEKFLIDSVVDDDMELVVQLVTAN